MSLRVEWRKTVGLTYRGRNLRRFQREATELEMRVALPDDLQPGLGSLEDLPIPRDRGDTIPLGTVADVTVARMDAEIEREDRETTTWVTAEFDKSITTQDAQALAAAGLTGLHMPEGYRWDWGRWGRRHQSGLDTMLFGVVLSMVAVILLMTALFESFAQPMAILITLPLAFVGGFLVVVAPWLRPRHRWLHGHYHLDRHRGE